MIPMSMRPTVMVPRPRTAGKAVASLLLGLSSLTCIGAVTGFPAIILGAMARRDIDQSNGSLTGRGMAAGGIVSGLFGTGIGVVVVLWLMGAMFAPDDPTSAANASATASSASTAAPAASASPSAAPSSESPKAASGITRTYGTLEVVDLDESRPLRAQLTEIVQRAHSHNRTVMLQTVVRSSAACDAVAASLPDSRMQHALANVTLIRVSVEEYSHDLSTMKVETKTAPWFYKLDSKAEPTDALSADTWSANVPEVMAPVLGKFVHRPTTARPHRGPHSK
jgi:Spy/CpxP family protein refolding chaperone